MGIIADTLRLQLEELKRRDLETNRMINELIKDTRGLIKELEAIDLETE